ncbi:TPA: hypothetical protein ACXPG6_002374 [Klebsiella pneumoniae]|uniref:hypothetical protein n=1 Tax=Klebsiella pneumoniae TaxID=573 RepID=UPI000E2D7CEE|nr:hypothetical protein [Klebsiella pneumoniae]SVP56622.1 Uncharacterised protein [Klebsiella pneumoniae]SVP96750.1 Uncharacterised protein [Klebsiella pneumoniae]SVT62660.1 Uncharacterised protein [Klebsiella pneumoniae]HBU7751356.1 hypothetical protein [Klebsiella pneumoniae]
MRPDKNIKSRILPLEFCDLQKASSMLGCSVDDLFHWAEINAISLSLRLDYFPSFLSFDHVGGKDSAELFESLISEYNQVTLSVERRVSYFMPDMNNPEVYRDGNRIHVKGWAFGLWAIRPNKIRELSSVGQIELNEALVVDQHMDLYIKHDIRAFLRAENVFREKTLPILVRPSHGDPNPEEIINAINKKIECHTISKDDVLLSRHWIKKLHDCIENNESIYNSFDLDGFSYEEKEMFDINNVHGNVEISARKREEVYKAAIYWLLNDPESCKGKKGDITQQAWAKRIVEGRHEKPISLGEDKIIKCLREAMKGDKN